MNKYFDEWLECLANPITPAPLALCSKREYSFRISRQSGNFTLHSPIQPLNYYWNNITIEGEQFADSITINPEAVSELREWLEVLNIKKETLYKFDNDRMDGECKILKQKFIDEFNFFYVKHN